MKLQIAVFVALLCAISLIVLLFAMFPVAALYALGIIGLVALMCAMWGVAELIAEGLRVFNDTK